MRRTPIHHATFHASELGRGSSVEAVNAETIDIAIGMANDVAEMRNPVRERADHRWPRSSRCSDTERILCIRNVENLTIAEKLLIVVATFSTRTVSTTPRQKEDHIHHRSKISWINEGSPSWTRPSHAGRRRGGFLGVGSSKMGMKIKRRRADLHNLRLENWDVGWTERLPTLLTLKRCQIGVGLFHLVGVSRLITKSIASQRTFNVLASFGGAGINSYLPTRSNRPALLP